MNGVRRRLPVDMFGRFFYSDRDRFIPGNYGGIADGTSSSAFGKQNMKTYTFAAGWNHTLAASALNEFRFGYNKANSNAVQEPFGQTGIPLSGVPADPRVAGGLAGINFSTGGYRLGSPDFLPKYQQTQQFQFTDTLTLSRGANQWKFGIDLMMPLMDGYETLGILKQDVRLKQIPVIAVTAKAMKGDREKCLEAGASDYIAKPVNTDQLVSLLRVWLYR